MPPEISIVIPAFEEVERVGDSITRILSFLQEWSTASELIVVDDGSGDHTAETVEAALQTAGNVSTKLIRYEKNRGKGFAVKTGLLAAAADIALFTDADL